MKPKDKGVLTECICKLAFIKLGIDVSVPIGDNSRYDFIVDINHHLYKVQCKSSYAEDSSSFIVNCVRTQSSRTKTRIIKYSTCDVDFFCTVWKDVVYLIPFQGEGSFKLRIVYPNFNPGGTKIRWAREYEVDYVVGRLLGSPEYPLRDVDSEFKSYLESIGRNLSTSKNIYHWYTDGIVNRRIAVGTEVPYGFYPGRAGKVNQFT